MTLEEQIIEMKKQGCTYFDIQTKLKIGCKRIVDVLREAGMVKERERKKVIPNGETSLGLDAITREDLWGVRARIKVGTKLKIRTEKGNVSMEHKIPDVFHIGTVTSVDHKRFLTVKYETGIKEFFLWQDILIMMRKGQCMIVKR